MSGPGPEFWAIIADIIGQANREAREWPDRKYCEVQLIRPEIEALRLAYVKYGGPNETPIYPGTETLG